MCLFLRSAPPHPTFSRACVHRLREAMAWRFGRFGGSPLVHVACDGRRQRIRPNGAQCVLLADTTKYMLASRVPMIIAYTRVNISARALVRMAMRLRAAADVVLVGFARSAAPQHHLSSPPPPERMHDASHHQDTRDFRLVFSPT